MTEADECILAALVACGWRPAGGVEALRTPRGASSTDAKEGPRGPFARWIEEGQLDPWWAAESLAGHFGLRAISRTDPLPDEAKGLASSLSPRDREALMAWVAFPLSRGTTSVEVAVENPLDDALVARLGLVFGLPVVPVVAPAGWIGSAWRQSLAPRVRPTTRVSRSDEVDRPANEARSTPDSTVEGRVDEDAPRGLRRAPNAPKTPVNLPEPVSIGDMVDTLFAEAIDARASDIHLEPIDSRLRVRLRVDGHLCAAGEIGPNEAAAVIARTKLLAGLSIVERRTPQDGRFRWSSGRRTRDLRVATLPTVRGESVVVRILGGSGDSCTESTRLGDIFPVGTAARWEELIQASDGLMLVTGPTGSGKSSTLHATLSRLVQAGRKVVSLEDPVEREQAGVVQVGIRPDLGLGFPESVRAVLRQSPEVIAVGEIRDGETARSCLNASLTGHLVLTTLHTADAVGAIVRLRDLGMSPSLLASALRGVVAQRLVRRCCRTCSGSPTSASASGRACTACAGGGFLGRVALTELLVVDETLRQLIRVGAPAETLRLAAKAAGFRGLVDHGRDRVHAGITTAAEVARVLGEEVI